VTIINGLHILPFKIITTTYKVLRGTLLAYRNQKSGLENKELGCANLRVRNQNSARNEVEEYM
jgi:hypothetical protein